MSKSRSALTRVYVEAITKKYPKAIMALSLTEDEIEQTDYCFYVDSKGTLFCESSDEQMAFKYCAPFEWLLLDYFPLRSESQPRSEVD